MKTHWSSRILAGITAASAAGCIATPQYAVRPVPLPDESAQVAQLERAISNQQAEMFEQESRVLEPYQARTYGFNLDRVANKLAAVTERPHIRYHVRVLDDKDPNAAALADGRLYITQGMLDLFNERGRREDELAFVLGHEIGHTTAQHLVKRYKQIYQQQLLTAAAQVAIAALATKGASSAQGAADAMRIGNTITNVVSNVYFAGYSQEQELEADQLGLRYVIKAGYNPWAGVTFSEDFEALSPGGLYLSTHPNPARRAQDMRQFLADIGIAQRPVVVPSHAPAPRPLPPAPAKVSVPPSHLRLERIIWDEHKPANRRAVINGTAYKLGDLVDRAYQVAAIARDQVRLDQGPHRYWLRLNQ